MDTYPVRRGEDGEAGRSYHLLGSPLATPGDTTMKQRTVVGSLLLGLAALALPLVVQLTGPTITTAAGPTVATGSTAATASAGAVQAAPLDLGWG
ncbi:hypothetical protein [Streptacidiphilus sp. PAMC 29251]